MNLFLSQFRDERSGFGKEAFSLFVILAVDIVQILIHSHPGHNIRVHRRIGIAPIFQCFVDEVGDLRKLEKSKSFHHLINEAVSRITVKRESPVHSVPANADIETKRQVEPTCSYWERKNII